MKMKRRGRDTQEKQIEVKEIEPEIPTCWEQLKAKSVTYTCICFWGGDREQSVQSKCIEEEQRNGVEDF